MQVFVKWAAILAFFGKVFHYVPFLSIFYFIKYFILLNINLLSVNVSIFQVINFFLDLKNMKHISICFLVLMDWVLVFFHIPPFVWFKNTLLF